MTIGLPYVRDDYQVMFDIQFGMRSARIHRRFYLRLATVLEIVNFISGTSAFGAALGKSSDLAMWSGLVVALSSALLIYLKPYEKAEGARNTERAYSDLYEKVVDAGDAKSFDRELASIQKLDGPDIELLRYPAYNQTLDEIGSTSNRLPLSWLQKLFQAVA